jgi:SPP1 gp7 family putative phage head morphogenesis protein
MVAAVLSLLDALARHQIYLEGLKQSDEANFTRVQFDLEREVRVMLAGIAVLSLGQLTRMRLNIMIAILHKRQLVIWDAYQRRLLKFLREFMVSDLAISERLYTKTLGKDATKADAERQHNTLYGIAAINNDDRLWSIVTNAPVPAAGTLPLDLITGLAATAIIKIDNLVRKAYANNSTADDLLRELTGTAANKFKDGAIATFRAQAETVTGTLMQHISATAQAALASLYFPTYRWVSVIDNVTTPICRARNNHIFKYIDGPQPPAHFNCRSKTVPITNTAQDENAPPGFYVWVRSQPVSVQNDALGQSRARRLRAGTLKAADVPKFDNLQAITLAQFRGRVTRMLEDA